MGAMRVVKDFKALGRLWIRLAAAMAVFAVQCPTVAVANPFPYTLQWKRLVPGIGGGAVAWRDSLVYVGTTDGRVLAVGRADGVRRWQRRGLGPVRKGLAIAGADVFLGDAWGGVRRLAGADGVEVWAFQRQGWGDAAVALGAGLAHASGADGWLYALGLEDGAEAWRVRVGSRLAARPLVRRGRLYAPTTDGRLLAIDAARGHVLQALEVGALAPDGVHGRDGLLLAAFGDGYVRAYGENGLALAWERRLGAQAELTVVGKRLVAAADNGWLYGLDVRDGDLVWKQSLGAPPTGPAIVGPRGEVAVGTAAGRALAVAAADGAAVWDVQLLADRGVRLAAGGDGFYALGDDDYLYAFAEVAPLKTEGAVQWEMWWNVLDRGDKTGYRRQQLLAGRAGGQPVWWLVEEAVQWRSGFRRSAGQVLVGRDFRPLAAEERVIEGSQVVEFAARWQGDSLRVERRLAGYAIADGAQIAPAAVPIEVALLKLAAEGRARPGRVDSLLVVDYDLLTTRWLRFAFGVAEGAGLAVRIGADAAELLAWIDAEGRPRRVLNPRTGAEQVRVDAETARAWVPPGSGRSVRLSHALDDPAAVAEMVIALPEVAGLQWVEDRRQALAVGAQGRRLLAVRAVPYDGSGAVELPIRDPALAPYLASSLYIQADDPRIRALALRLRGDGRDAWQVALRLRQWVFDHMIPRDTNVRFKSTLEVLQDMEGTCSEYAALYMALCRAAGIPARAAVGFLVGPAGELGLHIWTQVYVGEWIDLDPSQAAETVSAAHIKTAQAALTPAGQRELNGSLMGWLAQVDTLELVEYHTDRRRFSHRAEMLFAEAEEADKHFAAARARELYHELVALPWNHRSGAALVRIARARLQRGELDDAEWALTRLLRLGRRGEEGDDGLFYLARLADARQEPQRARDYLAELVRDFPDGDLADDALGQLADRALEEGGCQQALPYYRRLREEYSRTGWAAVAESAIVRCRQEGPNHP